MSIIKFQINQNIPDVIQSKPKQQQPILPQITSPYSAGTEGQLRRKEGNSAIEAAIKVVPIPEGRMRIQESNNFSKSLDANITRIDRRDKIQPKKVTTVPAKKVATTVKPVVTGSTNPFGDEDDDNDYDKLKNPFSADDAEEEVGGEATSTNPFGEYDDNLNPFS